MSYCFIFSNIYLKIFFMIKVYGCEKKWGKKNSQDGEIVTWKDFAKSSISISTCFFFYSKNIFVFLNESLILINIFSNLYFHHYYWQKKYLFRNVKFYIKYGVHVFIVVGMNSYWWLYIIIGVSKDCYLQRSIQCNLSLF